MMFYVGLLLLVTAVSLDGFGVGISYGMQKIKLPLVSLLVIMCCSGIVVLIAMTIGNLITQFISEDTAGRFGGVLLIGIGLFSLYNMLKKPKSDNSNNTDKERTLQSLIDSPADADRDRSGSISPQESIFLGVALALDAFGAGIGAAIIGYQPMITAILVGVMSGTFVFSGMKLGLLLIRWEKLQKIGYLAPLLLIVLGVFNTL